MSYYNFDDVMLRLDDIESKIDTLIENKQKQTKEYTYDYYSSFWNDDTKRKAEVFKRGDGEWGCEYYVKDAYDYTEVYEGKSEAYAESAAENYINGVKN